MKRETSGPCLSAVFVDYDNIYMSLKRKDDEAAKRFAKDAPLWLKAIETGALITPTNTLGSRIDRRIVMNRCYGNPVPRRNPRDNSTDMCSFPFVRHHFLRGGFEIVDCPPLTAQLKNSSDIRIVMDVRDYLTHETYFDEFIILSGDADFTPVLHRLRAHARRTVIFANEQTASPYTAICDGEVREVDLIRLLLDGRLPEAAEPHALAAPRVQITHQDLEGQRRAILAEVVAQVKESDRPVPIETLADRAQRSLGHERTVAGNWGGAGSFRALLAGNLPDGIRLTEHPPYLALDPRRHADPEAKPAAVTVAAEPAPARAEPVLAAPAVAPQPAAVAAAAGGMAATAAAAAPAGSVAGKSAAETAPGARRGGAAAINLQQSIARIHEACQAPPLAPQEYRALFEAMAAEIADHGAAGAQTISNVVARAAEAGIEMKRDDVRFVLEVVSEADPWFDQGRAPICSPDVSAISRSPNAVARVST
ncbi:MAG: NYN domain-containing protein [Hyphomicrobiaceae bacterium]